VIVNSLELSSEPDYNFNQLHKLIDGWDPPKSMPAPSKTLQQAITISMAKGEISAAKFDSQNSQNTQSDLDSHANMIVAGKHCFIISYSGKYIDVNAFADAVGGLSQVPIVDAAITYDCPYTHKSWLLILRNVLYVESMEKNLIPPFILREGGIIVNEKPKIHCEEPTEDDHTIQDPKTGLFIELKLDGCFSYFNSRKPTHDDLLEAEVVVITPEGTSWNPHSEHYALNEDTFTDFEGNMMQRSYIQRNLIEEEDVPAIDCADIDAVLAAHHEASVRSDFNDSVAAEISAVINSAHVLDGHSNTKDNTSFETNVNNAAAISDYKMSIGSTCVGPAVKSNDLFESEPVSFQVDLNELDSIIEDISNTNANIKAAMAGRPKGVTPQHLSKVWKIDVDTAKRTIDATTQLRQHDANASISRNYSTNDRMLRYKRINSHFFTDTFFVTKKAKSQRGNNCMQLFVSDKGFVYVVPMKTKSDFPFALKQFAKEIGVPIALISDPAGEQTSNAVKSIAREMDLTLKVLEESTQWANLAELYIGLMKESIREDMRTSDSPIVFWDYCAERRALVNNLTAKKLPQLQGVSNAHTLTTGDVADISNSCVHEFFGWCMYRNQGEDFPYQKKLLGRVLGPAKHVANEMAQYVVTNKGSIVPRRTVRPLTDDENRQPVIQHQKTLFMEMIRDKYGDSLTVAVGSKQPNVNPDDDESNDYLPYEDEEEIPRTMPESEALDYNGKPINMKSITDQLVGLELNLPQGEEMLPARVIGLSMDDNGRIIGNANENPILNTTLYDVQFSDGMIKTYAANTIAENVYNMVNEEGESNTTFDGIISHRKNKNAIEKKDRYVTVNNKRFPRKTTAGWQFKVAFKDGSVTTSQWIPLKELKESNPVQIAEYATARGISTEPAFSWWVPYTLRKMKAIVSAVKSRVKHTTHKYGVEVPRSFNHAKQLDKKNVNTLWIDAWEKEMTNVSIAFEILEENETAPSGWKQSSGHLIWDVKMDFTRKARWVKDGHRTPDPETSNYAGVVSRDSVRIALTYAALNDLDVCAADVQNAYLQAPSSEKHYVVCGKEFGEENEGRIALIRRALYGGKSAGRDYWLHMRSCMEYLKFTSCKADADVWMRPATRSNGTEYYEYVLLYVDDCLVVSENPEAILRQELGKYFKLKEASIGPPDIYLGGKMRQVVMENGVKAWSFSSSQYVQEAVNNVYKYLMERNKKFPSKSPGAAIKNEYRPEVDQTDELSPTDAAYYQSLIGVLRWIVELGRVDICCEVSMLSSCLALPREGHLEQLFHIFAYLKGKHNTEMIFDPSLPVIEENLFPKEDWSSSVYATSDCELKENTPPNMPGPRGQGFTMRVYVDSDHAGDTITRRSRTGFLVYLNCSLIHWMSKKQTSIETSSFGSEFMAMKAATEYVRGLRFKLRMMGIPVEGHTYIYGDNQSVLANTTMPHSNLKKKSNAIAFHFVREGTARDEWRTAYINTHDNPSDMLTKPLPSGEKRRKFCRMVLYHY
jgi:hypothetical protein